MKILLTTLNAKYIHINLAIRLLYQLNKEKHAGLDWKEFTIKEDRDEIAEHCAQYNIVTFSCYIWNITQTIEVIKKIKLLNPKCVIILGGPEVSYDYEDIIAIPEVDYIIEGEGEIPFQEFISSYPNVNSVPGLVFKNEGKVVINKAPAMFDLNLYANINPYQDDDPSTLRNRVCYVETSRGCPYKCEFCLASLDNKVRYIPNETLKDNLLYLMKHARVVKFLDRTFNIKKDFTIDIFKFILEHHHPENVFQFEITADIVHPDIIKFIDEHVPPGLFRFEIGIQTVNAKSNLEVNRKQNFEKTKSIIKALEHKIEMHLDLIVGLPLEYMPEIKYSFEEVFKLYAPELQLGFLKFLKGTPVRHKSHQHDYVYDPNPPYQIIESKYLSKQELEDIVALEHALEIYWNGKKALNTLKYICEHHSIFDFLMALGKFFGTQRSYHKYSLEDVFTILSAFIKGSEYENDIVHDLIALDYFLHFKVKPKTLFITELEQSERIKYIAEYKLNHHKFRHIIFDVHFNLSKWFNEGIMESKKDLAIVEFDGVKKSNLVIQANYKQALI